MVGDLFSNIYNALLHCQTGVHVYSNCRAGRLAAIWGWLLHTLLPAGCSKSPTWCLASSGLKGNTLETNSCFDQGSIVAFMSESLNSPRKTALNSSASLWKDPFCHGAMKLLGWNGSPSSIVQIQRGAKTQHAHSQPGYINTQLPVSCHESGFLYLFISVSPLLSSSRRLSPSLCDPGWPPALLGSGEELVSTSVDEAGRCLAHGAWLIPSFMGWHSHQPLFCQTAHCSDVLVGSVAHRLNVTNWLWLYF